MIDIPLITAAALLAIFPISFVVGYLLNMARPARERSQANCSFCRKSYRDIGPLVEGPNQVYICHPCSKLCVGIIEMECVRQGKPVPKADPSEVMESV